MKVFVIVCLTVIFALAIGAPAPAISPEEAAWQAVVEAAKREGVLISYTDIFGGETGVQTSKAFKDKYGISLEFMTAPGNTRRQKIRMEQKSKSYVSDACDGGGTVLYSLKSDGYLESVAADLPVLKEKDKFAISTTVDPEKQMLAVMTRHNGFWFNTNLVKPGEEPKSYYDLLDPKWKGKIYLANPLYSSGAEITLAVFVNAKVLTVDYFKNLYMSATLGGPAGPREIMDKLIRGEFAIGGPVGAASSIPLLLSGAPIKPLDLKEGTLYGTTKWGALKNRPHPNATKLFINWFLSKEGQLLVSKVYGSDGVRNDIPSVVPFSLKGPIRIPTYELEVLADERYSTQYLAKMLGIKQ